MNPVCGTTLGVAKQLWQPDLSVESHAGCYSCGVGELGLMGHWLLLPQQPHAAVAVTKCAQTSQRQQKQQPWEPLVPSWLSQCCPYFSHSQGAKAHTKRFWKFRIYSAAQCICLIKITNFNSPGLSPLLLVTYHFLFIFIFISHSVLKWCEGNICSHK